VTESHHLPDCLLRSRRRCRIRLARSSSRRRLALSPFPARVRMYSSCVPSARPGNDDPRDSLKSTLGSAQA
jgi:hypothetical protein